MENAPYKEVADKLTCTSPDLYDSVSSEAQFMENSGCCHRVAVKSILRYLKGTIDLGLLFRITDSADSGGDIDNRRFASGHCVMFCQARLSWQLRSNKWYPYPPVSE